MTIAVASNAPSTSEATTRGCTTTTAAKAVTAIAAHVRPGRCSAARTGRPSRGTTAAMSSASVSLPPATDRAGAHGERRDQGAVGDQTKSLLVDDQAPSPMERSHRGKRDRDTRDLQGEHAW